MQAACDCCAVTVEARETGMCITCDLVLSKQAGGVHKLFRKLVDNFK